MKCPDCGRYTTLDPAPGDCETCNPDSAASALRQLATETYTHLMELEEAWRRGAISEHDGQGGKRSNQNADLRRRWNIWLVNLGIKERSR